MKKLLLVNTNTEKSPYPIPPLGLCLIASYLENRYEVKIYDGMFDEGRDLNHVIESFTPDFIGFSIRNVDEVVPERARFFVEGVARNFIFPARKSTTVPFILGGSGYTIFPEEILEYTGADYGITGEGEEALLLLLEKLEKGEDPSGIQNLYIRNQTGKHASLRWNTGKENTWSNIDLRIDFRPYTQRGVYSIQTKRGCALQCIYCSYPLIEGRKYRLRSPDDISSEIREASERLGPSVTFEFVDSTFNEPRGHAEEICRALIRKNIRVRLRTMGVNPGNTSRELFELMIRAGFAQIDVTPDSASETMIRNLYKGFTIDDIRRTADLIREFDLPSMWFFLMGGPGENRRTFDETIAFIDQYINPNDLVYISGGLRVYPGTPLYRKAIEEGLAGPADNLLQPSLFYFSKESPHEELARWITEACRDRLNCLPGFESNPPSGMLQEALELRSTLGLNEPMFRSLLRVRRDWRAKGKI